MRGLIRLTFPAVMVLAVGGCGSPADDSEGASLLTLVLEDSIGVELGDSSYVFGAITGMEFMPDGGFAVLDRASCNIRLYDHDGVYQSTVGRRGSGPGEIVQPFGLLVWSNGDLGVIDPFQGGLLRFNTRGDYLGVEMEVTHNVPVYPRMVGDTGYVAQRSAFFNEGGQDCMEAFLGFFPMTWEPSVKYVSRSVPLDPNIMGDFFLTEFFYSSWAVDPEAGVIYAAPFQDGAYRILAFPLGGGDPGEITLQVEPVPKTPEEIETERAYVAALLTTAEGGDPQYNVICEPYPFRIPVAGMEVDDRGNLWVLRGDLDGTVFDVWSPEGRLIHTADLPGFAGGDLRFRIRDSQMLLYRENPLDFQKIYFIEIPW
jgi:hypothetical protein